MNPQYKVTSHTVTKKVITLEMDEDIANQVATSIDYYLFNNKTNLGSNIYYNLEQVKNSIKGHL